MDPSSPSIDYKKHHEVSSEGYATEDETTSLISSSATLITKSSPRSDFRWKKEAQKWQDHSERQQTYYERLMVKLQEKNVKLDALLHSCIQEKTKALASLATKEKVIVELRHSQTSLKYNLERSEKTALHLQKKGSTPEKNGRSPMKRSTPKPHPTNPPIPTLEREKESIQNTLVELQRHADAMASSLEILTTELKRCQEANEVLGTEKQELENMLSQTFLEKNEMEERLNQEINALQERLDQITDAMAEFCPVSCDVEAFTVHSLGSRLFKLVNSVDNVEAKIHGFLEERQNHKTELEHYKCKNHQLQDDFDRCKKELLNLQKHDDSRTFASTQTDATLKSYDAENDVPVVLVSTEALMGSKIAIPFKHGASLPTVTPVATPHVELKSVQKNLPCFQSLLPQETSTITINPTAETEISEGLQLLSAVVDLQSSLCNFPPLSHKTNELEDRMVSLQERCGDVERAGVERTENAKRLILEIDALREVMGDAKRDCNDLTAKASFHGGGQVTQVAEKPLLMNGWVPHISILAGATILSFL